MTAWILAALLACGSSTPEPASDAPAASEPAEAAPPSAAKKKRKGKRKAKGKQTTEETASDAITQDNWKSHPEIKKIRERVNQINKLENHGELWHAMGYSFAKGCGDKGITKVEMVTAFLDDSSGGQTEASRFVTVESQGDIGRETTAYYDESGSPLFAASVYTHASAESVMVSRVYYKEGKVLFTPDVEQTSENSGPKDDAVLASLVQPAVADAQSAFFALRNECMALE